MIKVKQQPIKCEFIWIVNFEKLNCVLVVHYCFWHGSIIHFMYIFKRNHVIGVVHTWFYCTCWNTDKFMFKFSIINGTIACIPVLNCSMYNLSKLLYTHIKRPEARFEPGFTAKKQHRRDSNSGPFNLETTALPFCYGSCSWNCRFQIIGGLLRWPKKMTEINLVRWPNSC